MTHPTQSWQAHAGWKVGVWVMDTSSLYPPRFHPSPPCSATLSTSQPIDGDQSWSAPNKSLFGICPFVARLSVKAPRSRWQICRLVWGVIVGGVISLLAVAVASPHAPRHSTTQYSTAHPIMHLDVVVVTAVAIDLAVANGEIQDRQRRVRLPCGDGAWMGGWVVRGAPG